MARINIIVAIAFSVFAIVVLIFSSAIPVSASQPLTLGTPTFPRILSYGILFLSAILIFTNLHEARNEKQEDRKRFFEPGHLKIVGSGLAIILGSVIVMYFLGFIIAMIIMNIAFLKYFKVKNKIVLVLEPILVPLIIYIIFQNVLNIPLPSGIFFLLR
ncbi:MAG: tripartite tricarboxylate transporter TctB family protein [Sphaerochaeta sp.]